jgi:hypothetical protein
MHLVVCHGVDPLSWTHWSSPGSVESFALSDTFPSLVVAPFELSRRYVTDRLEKPPMIEPVDPLKRGELDLIKPFHVWRRRITSAL